MPDALSKALRTRLARSPQLRRHLDDLHQLSGLDISFLDSLGNILLTTPRGGNISLCQILRRTERTGRSCTLCRQGLLLESPATVLCKSGLRQIATPILLDQIPLGYLVLSGYRDPEHGLEETKAAWVQSARAGSAWSWTDWESRWRQAPAFTPHQTEALRRWMDLAARDALRRLEELTPEDPLTRDRAFPPLIRQACDLIRDRYHTPLQLRDVAAACQVSSEHLSRLFHAQTGLRFRDYLAEVRLNHACELLRETTRPIAGISENVGYSTLSRFNSAFRSHTGTTPSAYRKHEKPLFRSSEKGF